MNSEPQAPAEVAPGSDAAFPVVGIGASAGGLDPIEKVLSRLTANGMAFVVVQHLAAGRDSALTEILGRAAKLPVEVMRDGQAVEPNRVYVVPPDADARVEGRVFRLTRPMDATVPRRGIDSFFRSLAKDVGRAAVGVILSGTGSDGTLGLRAVKEEGGITFVQDPATAAHSGMPQSAIDAGLADLCLAPEEIGDELVRLAAHPYVARGALPRSVDEETLGRIFAQLNGAFSVDFANYKRATVERRIQRRMALHKLETIADYHRYLQNSPTELSLLYSDLLIGVTSFFRDPELYDSLAKTVFPRLLEGRVAGSPIRIWVAGCATGEEAYSILFCLLEVLGDRAAMFKVQIFATDIDEQALVKARQALYPRSIELDLSPQRLQRFFTVEEQGYRVTRRVRDLVVFARHNLGKDPPFSHQDLVSCRNVLIYLKAPLQRRILRIFHYTLKPGGVLLLGLSESVGEENELFGIVEHKLRIYTKQNVLVPPRYNVDFDAHRGAHAAEAFRAGPLQTVQQLADRAALEQYAPPGALVTDDLDVLQFRGRIGPFLEPVPGSFTPSLLKLLRPELVPLLRATVHEVRRTRAPASSPPGPPTPTGQGAKAARVVIDVLPVAVPPDSPRCFLVLFKEQPVPTPVASAAEGAGPVGDPRVEELERALQTTKDSLRSSIEEQEAANEELQSSNEELESANEELQSTNEELESSKEELQSTNEELTTVNDELQSRMAQLTMTSDDVKNLLGAVSAAVLLVGADLRLRAFSTTAEKLFNLIPSDVGRPVAFVRTVMMAGDLEETVAQVIGTATPREQRVRSTDGLWYTMRILPYRTADGAIQGAVFELTRAAVTARASSAGELGELATELLSSLPQALMLLDEQLRIFWANREFLRRFKPQDDLFGQPLEKLWDGRIQDPELWTLLEDVASGGQPFSNVRVERPFAPSGSGAMIFSAHRIPATADRPLLTLVVMTPEAESHEGGDRGTA